MYRIVHRHGHLAYDTVHIDERKQGSNPLGRFRHPRCHPRAFSHTPSSAPPPARLVALATEGTQEPPEQKLSDHRHLFLCYLGLFPSKRIQK